MNPFFEQWRTQAERWSRHTGLFIGQIRKREAAIGAAGLMLGVGLTGLMLSARSPDPATPAARSAAVTPATTDRPPKAQSDDQPPVPVKIIGATAEPDRPCEEQTWPYLDRRCLVEAPPRTRVTPTVTTPEQVVPQESETASSVTGTTGSAPREVVVAPVGQHSETNPAPADDDTDKAAAAPATDATTKAEIAKTPVQHAPEPPPASRTTKAAQDDKPDKKVATQNRRAETKSRRKDREEPAARTARTEDLGVRAAADAAPDRHGHKSRTREVKRWRELVYDYPDGQRERVIVDGDDDALQPRVRRTPLSPFFFGGDDD